MASLLRRIVAGPRSRHADTDLDLCYVTQEIIATSGPSATYPQLAYRNPLQSLVRYLDERHPGKWAIWEFRAEGTGYPDSAVHHRIWHYPFPDHHPPPFALVPLAMASMRDWLLESKTRVGADKNKGNVGVEGRVVVVHCKAGKGRSGTMACAYLISQCGWTPTEALNRFTQQRMRSGFGEGVSIPSQLRYVQYVDQWTKQNKVYIERDIEILELRIWGLREGVKIAVNSYICEGKVIKTFHVFSKEERTSLDTGTSEAAATTGKPGATAASAERIASSPTTRPSYSSCPGVKMPQTTSDQTTNALLRPATALIVPTSDINIDFERRTFPSKYTSISMVTSVAHVWFNAFFEAYPGALEGSFEIDWDEMDIIKGSLRKRSRILDKLSVKWRARPSSQAVEMTADEGDSGRGGIIRERTFGEEIKLVEAAD